MVGQGRPYGSEERKAIVDYIVEHKAYAHLKGNSLWQEMEAHIPNRTWQSLREHFRKQIYPKLHHTLFGLTYQEIELFRQCYEHKAKKHKVPTVDKVEEPSMDDSD